MKPTTYMTTKIGINLFKLTTRIKDAFQAILAGTNDETGEISDEALELVTQLELHGEAEALDAACAVRELEEVEEAFARQIARLAVRKSIIAKQQEYLRTLIEKAVPTGSKLADDRVTISWRRSEQTGVACDPSELPTKYTRVKVEADKTAIKTALKAGKTIDGCSIIEVQNLQIK